MREIVIARLDKPRPVLVLTREYARPYMNLVTVAPITSTVKGLATEVPVGQENGLDHACVVSCDNIQTTHVSNLGKHVGFLLAHQEAALAKAIATAFELESVIPPVTLKRVGEPGSGRGMFIKQPGEDPTVNKGDPDFPRPDPSQGSAG